MKLAVELREMNTFMVRKKRGCCSQPCDKIMVGSREGMFIVRGSVSCAESSGCQVRFSVEFVGECQASWTVASVCNATQTLKIGDSIHNHTDTNLPALRAALAAEPWKNSRAAHVSLGHQEVISQRQTCRLLRGVRHAMNSRPRPAAPPGVKVSDMSSLMFAHCDLTCVTDSNPKLPPSIAMPLTMSLPKSGPLPPTKKDTWILTGLQIQMKTISSLSV
jgi:hypothetical protein